MKQKNPIQKSNTKISKLREKLITLRDKLQNAPKKSLFKPLYRIRIQRIANAIQIEKELIQLEEMYESAYNTKYNEYLTSYKDITSRISESLYQEDEMLSEIQNLKYTLPGNENSYFQDFDLQNSQLLKQIPKQYRSAIDNKQNVEINTQDFSKSNPKLFEAQQRLALLNKQLESIHIDRANDEDNLRNLQENFKEELKNLKSYKKQDMSLIKPNLWHKIKNAISKFAENQKNKRDLKRREREELKAKKEAKNKEKDNSAILIADKAIGEKSEKASKFEEKLKTDIPEKEQEIDSQQQSTLDFENDFIPTEELYGYFNNSNNSHPQDQHQDKDDDLVL